MMKCDEENNYPRQRVKSTRALVEGHVSLGVTKVNSHAEETL